MASGMRPEIAIAPNSASLPWLDATTVMAATLILALGPFCCTGLSSTGASAVRRP
jgi:hypothetical protein